MCGKKYTQRSSLSLHLKIHMREKNFICHICEKSFVWKILLDQHLKDHTSENPHKCKECEKSFTQKSDLNKHMVVHTGEKPYSCNKCGKSYTQLSGLNYYKKKCNGYTSDRPIFKISFDSKNSGKSMRHYLWFLPPKTPICIIWMQGHGFV